MTIEAELRATVARADADSRLLHEIVHGDAAATVQTEGGPVKSVAKAIEDVETAVAGAANVVTEAARDEAAAARDTAQATIGGVLVSDTDTAPARLSVKLAPGTGIETAIEEAGGDERLALSVTPQLNAGALIALANSFI